MDISESRCFHKSTEYCRSTWPASSGCVAGTSARTDTVVSTGVFCLQAAVVSLTHTVIISLHAVVSLNHTVKKSSCCGKSDPYSHK